MKGAASRGDLGSQALWTGRHPTEPRRQTTDAGHLVKIQSAARHLESASQAVWLEGSISHMASLAGSAILKILGSGREWTIPSACFQVFSLRTTFPLPILFCPFFGTRVISRAIASISGSFAPFSLHPYPQHSPPSEQMRPANPHPSGLGPLNLYLRTPSKDRGFLFRVV